MRLSLALVSCLGLLGCWPPIDDLVTEDGPGPVTRDCSLPDPALGIAAPGGLVDTSYPKLLGTSHSVAPGGDLQGTIDAANPGDEIVLEAGAEYAGPIRLPFKSDTGAVIVIRSEALADIPQGRPVALEDATRLATITSTGSEPAVIAEERARGYRLAGLLLRPPAGVEAPTLLEIGALSSTVPEALPTEIVVDRTLIAGDPALGARTGIELNARSAAIVDSRIVDIKRTAADSRGLVIDNAPGPILVHSSVIEAAWQNVAIGERAPGSAALYPTDISICRSVLRKHAAWPDEGWATRSLIEITRGRRILVAGSLLEDSFPAVQPGIGIALDDDGLASGQPTEDIAFVDLRLRNVQEAIETNTSGAAGGVARVLFENSEITRVSDRLFRLLGGGIDRLTLVHLTGVADHSLLEGASNPNPNLLVRDGLFDHGLYGIRGDGIGSGTEALDAYFAPWTVTGNIIVGGSASSYPEGNFFPPTMFEAGVVDAAGENFRLSPDSAFAGQASDGTNPGADIDRLEAALPAP